MPDILNRFKQCRSQLLRPLPVAFEQVKRHALRRLGPDTRQAFKRIDELLQ
jgi:hypothetical protein